MNTPGTEPAAKLGFAIADMLLKTLVAKGVLTEAEVNGLLEGCAKTLEGDTTHSGKLAASFLREWMLPKH